MKISATSLLRRAVVWTLVAIIVGLLIYQYCRNRSLWLDEAALSLNIIEKDPLALFKPLEYNQIAPILFLLIEKMFTLVFGNNDLALRIFPLISAVLTLPLFFDFGSALTRNWMIPFVGLCLFVCTPKYIYYGSEAKQYSSDMFVLCGIYFAAFSESAFARRNRKVLLTVAGGVAVFLSGVAVIPMTIVGSLLIYRCIYNKKDRPVYTLPLVVWAACFGINFLAFIFHNPVSEMMKGYWSEYFMPWPWQSGFGDWMIKRGVDVFGNLLPNLHLTRHYPRWPNPYPYLGMIVYGAGLAYLLATRKFRLAWLCVGPVVLHLLLSALKLYPFDLRLILYLVPLFLLVMATGLFALGNLIFLWLRKNWRPVPALVIALVPMSLSAYRAFAHIPYLVSEDIKPVISAMNKNIKDNYNVYVYYGAIPAFNYYKETGLVHFGKANIVKGTHPSTNEGYLIEMQPLKGPTWFLISHGTTREEEQYILKGMAERGPRLMDTIGYGSRAYLFDLK